MSLGAFGICQTLVQACLAGPAARRLGERGAALAGIACAFAALVVMAPAVSLASIVGPLAFSAFYFFVQRAWPGAVWLSVAAAYAM